MLHHHFSWIQIMLELITGCRAYPCHQAGNATLSLTEQGQQPESQGQAARERRRLDAVASIAQVVLHHAPRCPQVFLHPPWWQPRSFHCFITAVGVGSGPIPTKAVGCCKWTAGLNRNVKSHINSKNIKMITSSRVTFLFIYRISQLCMTNFAQSHYLEQFV